MTTAMRWGYIVTMLLAAGIATEWWMTAVLQRSKTSAGSGVGRSWSGVGAVFTARPDMAAGAEYVMVTAKTLSVCEGHAPDWSTIVSQFPNACVASPGAGALRQLVVEGDSGAMYPAGPPGKYTALVTMTTEDPPCRQRIRVPVTVLVCEQDAQRRE